MERDAPSRRSPNVGKIIRSHVQLDPWSRQYELGGDVMKAIDALATELRGNPRHFHIGSSTP